MPPPKRKQVKVAASSVSWFNVTELSIAPTLCRDMALTNIILVGQVGFIWLLLP